MKSNGKSATKNCGTKNCKTKNCNKTQNTFGVTDCKNKAGQSRKKKADSESDADPFGTYTGNPIGFGKHEKPVQDADDL